MMTAANLGARVTGLGFVVFTLGSVCWFVIGIRTGQTNLIASNGFLTLINILGIWRWFGRQRSYENGGKSAETASWRAATPALFTATGIAGMAVEDSAGKPLGRAVEALIECATGEISYIVVASGGVGGIAESLRAVPRDRVDFHSERLRVAMAKPEFAGLSILLDGDWPAQVQPPSGAA